ncbi:outer membrane protein [Sphingomonas lenta]|uniref:Opacity protein n=1 Tax=Sphingomonas lenta TaxID=1141887 RepID=A0A2A2SG87_9SPHN|nr:porin family protein [Sphingomonas lenta]PAX08314.1 opacity protein [Sphingomonas lenta]
MRKLLLTPMALGAALAAVPAAAQAQTAESVPHSGLRAEALVGYDALTSGEDSDGVAYGGAVGYDAAVGGITLGAEGEYTQSSIKGEEGNLLVSGDSARVTLGRDLYVGGRVGLPVSPATLVYGKAGYTNARINTRYTAGATTVRDKANADGLRLGAGVEQKIGSQSYVKAEYRYSNYKEIEDFDIDADRHQLMAGVGIRF